MLKISFKKKLLIIHWAKIENGGTFSFEFKFFLYRKDLFRSKEFWKIDLFRPQIIQKFQLLYYTIVL